MRFWGFIPFLLLVVFPTPLFAQSTAGTTDDAIVVSAFEGVENVAAQGGFVGGGRPDAFVGRTEIYRTGSGSGSTSRANTSRLATTTVRPRTTATTTGQRQMTRMPGATQLGGSNSQTIRSVTSLDSDMASLSVQRSLPTLDAHLARLPGIQGSQVTIMSSPTGSTAVLTGTVASDRARKVAQQLLLLEPGINRVDNRLEVR